MPVGRVLRETGGGILRVAVVGAAGYVGGYLCTRLLDRGHEIFSYSAGGGNGISLETGLFPSTFAFPTGLDAVYFLAQSPRYRMMPAQSAHLLSVNCVAAVQAAEAARHAGVQRFVYASTGNVYAPSFCPLAETDPVRRDNWYSLSKLMAEDALALYQACFDVTVARIFGVYGPAQKDKLVPSICESVRSGRELFVDRNPSNPLDLDGLKVSLIYIDDLVDALLGILGTRCGGVINLAGPEGISIRRMAETAGRVLDLCPTISVGGKSRESDLIADNGLFVKYFGKAKISFEEGMKRVLASVP